MKENKFDSNEDVTRSSAKAKRIISSNKEKKCFNDRMNKMSAKNEFERGMGSMLGT